MTTAIAPAPAQVKTQCTADAKTFNQHLALVIRAIPSRPNHPILANILLTAEAGRVTLSGFDNSIGIRTSFEANVDGAWAVTLPAKLLSDIISRLDGNITITLEDSGEGILIRQGSGKYSIRGIKPDEYPGLPVGSGNGVSLNAEALKDALAQTLFATSGDETKQVLTGLHLLAKGEALELAATDGHRLAVAHAVVNAGDDFELTIPAAALRHLNEIVNSFRSESNLELYYEQGQAVFQWGDQILTSRTLDGQYPNYPQLIPKSFERSGIIEKRLLLSALSRVAVVADQKNSVVKFGFNFDDQSLRISAEAQDVGSGEETLAVAVSGSNLEIAFNVRYLTDGLKAISTEEVEFCFNAATSPVVLKPVNGEQETTYLVMPVQVRV